MCYFSNILFFKKTLANKKAYAYISRIFLNHKLPVSKQRF